METALWQFHPSLGNKKGNTIVHRIVRCVLKQERVHYTTISLLMFLFTIAFVVVFLKRWSVCEFLFLHTSPPYFNIRAYNMYNTNFFQVVSACSLICVGRKHINIVQACGKTNKEGKGQKESGTPQLSCTRARAHRTNISSHISRICLGKQRRSLCAGFESENAHLVIAHIMQSKCKCRDVLYAI